MSEAVAITGIIVSGVVGPGVGGIVAQRQYRRARRSEREDDLLHVLDDVVLYVNRGRRALETTAELARAGAGAGDPEARAAWDQYAGDVLPPMRAAFQRVFVRLGRSSPIPLAIEGVRNAFFALRAPIDRYREGRPWSELDREYTASLTAFMTQQDELYDAINARVGLPSRSPHSKLLAKRGGSTK